MLTTVLGMHKTLGRLVDEGLFEGVGSRHATTEDFFALPLVGPARRRAGPAARCVQRGRWWALRSRACLSPQMVARRQKPCASKASSSTTRPDRLFVAVLLRSPSLPQRACA